MKIDDSSQFLQVNAVAQRVRQLIVGAKPRVQGDLRRPTAIALAELRAGKIEVYDPREAAELLAEDAAAGGEDENSTGELARAAFEDMFAEPEADAAAQAAPAAPAGADAGETPPGEAAIAPPKTDS